MDEMMKDYSLTPPGLMRPENGMIAENMPAENMTMNSGEKIDRMPIGMAYVPRQIWRDKYENDKALMRGTLFAELDLPFKGAKR